MPSKTKYKTYNYPCPVCKSTTGTRVIDSRYRPVARLLYRRRECLNPDCMERFNTYELTVSDEDSSKNKSIGSAVLHGRGFKRWQLKYT